MWGKKHTRINEDSRGERFRGDWGLLKQGEECLVCDQGCPVGMWVGGGPSGTEKSSVSRA